MDTITASPTKLRDGSWGARVPGGATIGQTIRIRTRAGKEWDACVERVVWTGDGVAIVATRSLDRRPAPASSERRGGICDECDEPRRNLTKCYDSSGILGMCCPRCAAMSRYERSFA